MSKRVLVIADTHFGSEVGLSPEVIVTRSNNRILANEIQLALNNEYYDMIDDVGTVDMLILNGDLVDGTNYYDEGNGTVTNNMDLQCEIGVDMLSDIKARKIVGCGGTAYHVKKNPNLDKRIIEELGGIFMDEVSITVNKTKIYANHKTSVRMNDWPSRPQAVARELLMAELYAMDFGKYNIICKSHAHYYVGLDMGDSLGFITPCWKGRDSFAKKGINPFAFNPSIGYLLFDINNDGTFSWTKSVKRLKGNNSIKTYDINDIPDRM